MADEITYSAAGDYRVAALLNREIHTLLYDPTDLRATCRFYPFDAAGSAALKIGKIDVDYAMAAPGDATTVANTAFGDANYSLTVARYALRFEMSDLANMTSPGAGNVDYMRVAQIVADSARLTFTDLLCALFPSLSTNTAGTSGAQFTMDDFFDALFALNTSLVPGPYYAVLHPIQFNHLLNSLRGEAGPVQYIPAAQDLLALRGPGFKGSFLGVELWQSDSVTEAGGDKRGAMYGQGAFAYTEGPVGKVTPMVDRRIAVADSSVFVTAAWDDLLATVRLVGNYYPAVAEAEDARGCKIVTTATP